MHVKKKKVGAVTQINIYPVASTQGTSPEEAHCSTKGISVFGVYDREFFITKAQGPDFAVLAPSGSMKEFYCEKMRELESFCDFNTLSIITPSGSSFDIDMTHIEATKVPGQVYRASTIVIGYDLGRKVGKWLSGELGQQIHLYRQSALAVGKNNRSNMALCSLCPEESVRYIREKLSLPGNVRANYFRPNVIITGCKALEEKWWSHVRIGDVYFQVKAPDVRVINMGESITHMPTLEEPEKLKHFQRTENFGHSYTLGVNALVVKGGEIKVGDPVFAAKYYGLAEEEDRGAEEEES
ncbi:hypothetical protein Btru_025451 [Bulinus truncatus]|nr:hypothetical protein Btru_025451 [Bulinus truncatus]